MAFEIIGDAVVILIMGIIILTAYVRSSGLMKEINKRADTIPTFKKKYLDARQRFLNAIDGLGAKEGSEKTTLKDFMLLKEADEVKDALEEYKKVLAAQAKDYKQLVLSLIPTASLLLVLLGILVSRYQLGWIFWTFFWLAILLPIAYLALSIRNVPKAHIGGKYFLENYYMQVGPGITTVWLWLESLEILPTKSFNFNPETDKITIPGEQSQEIDFDAAIMYRIKDVFSVIENIGNSAEALKTFVDNLLGTLIPSTARFVISRKLRTADEVLKMGPEIAGFIDNLIEVNYARFLGIDVDPTQIAINLSKEMIKARTDRTESEIKIVTAQNVRKQEFEKYMVNLDVLKHVKIDFPDDKRLISLLALLMVGKEGIAAFGGKLNFNMVQGMEELMSGLKGLGGKALNPDVVQGNAQKLLEKINGMDPAKLEELLKGVDLLTGGGK